MKFSWKVATLALLSSVAHSNAFVSSNAYHGRPTSSLGMARRARRRSMLPSGRFLLAPPSQIFEEMDQMLLEDSFSPFDDRLFKSPFMMRPSRPSPYSLDRADNRLSDFAVVRRPQPTYKLSEDEEKVELIVHIPGGAKAEDIKADLEQNGRVIRLSGVSKVEDDDAGVSIESRFEKAFVLGRRAGEKLDEDNISAKMSADGVLTIIAPKIVEEVKETRRRIDITEEAAPADALPTPEEQGESSQAAEAKNSIDADGQEEEALEKAESTKDIDIGEEDLDEDAVIEL